MAWKKLDINDLRLVLSEDEVLKLNELSLDQSVTEVINSTIELVTSAWRGALKAKGMQIDPRDYYAPSTYWYWILVHCRYACWSRFPQSSIFAIDDVRKKEYEKALELLKEPYLDVDEVEWNTPGGDPNPELTGYVKTGGSSLLTPWLAFPDEHPFFENYEPWKIK